MTEDNKRYGDQTPKIVRMGRKDAMDSLFSGLARISDIERTKDLSGVGFEDGVEFRRSMCIHMLAEFQIFLRRTGYLGKEPNSLSDLVGALTDADKGVSNDLFVPQRIARPGLPTKVLNLRGRVAAVQNFLMKKDWKKKDAATFILKALGADAVEMLRAQRDRRVVTWNTVDRWRTAVFEGSEKIMMGSAFEDMKAILSDQDPGGDPTTFAKIKLSQLRVQIVPLEQKFE